MSLPTPEFTVDDIQKLEARIDELKKALKPFADAADGFKLKSRNTPLEYLESDGNYCSLYYQYEDGDDTDDIELTVAELLQARNVYYGD